MVNFRYHLVSLIAVFLALAVGVVLGAGPLQNAIDEGPQTAGKAQELQQVKAELEQAQDLQNEYSRFIEALGSEVLPKTLEDHKIALVLLPGATAPAADEVVEYIELAGGEVVGRVILTNDWETTHATTYRDTLAGPVASHLEADPKDASSVGVLAVALVESLTTEGSKSDMLRDMLTDEATPLVEGSSLPAQVATEIVLVGSLESDAGSDESQSGATADDPARDRAWVALGSALAQVAPDSVIVGQALSDDQLVAVIRASEVGVSTVDQLGTPIAALNVALALNDKEVGAFGQGVGAESALAPFQISGD